MSTRAHQAEFLYQLQLNLIGQSLYTNANLALSEKALHQCQHLHTKEIRLHQAEPLYQRQPGFVKQSIYTDANQA